ncbi:hypothetical protein Lser_V15G21668 [Lactuca serriola]
MGPLSRAFFKECSLKLSLPRLFSPASDLSSPLSTGDLRLTSPHWRLERLLKFPSPRVDYGMFIMISTHLNNTTTTHSHSLTYSADQCSPYHLLLAFPWFANQIRFAKAHDSMFYNILWMANPRFISERIENVVQNSARKPEKVSAYSKLSNANPPFWIPIHIVIPERPTESTVFNVIAATSFVKDASCWQREHEWRQDIAVITKWLSG